MKSVKIGVNLWIKIKNSASLRLCVKKSVSALRKLLLLLVKLFFKRVEMAYDFQFGAKAPNWGCMLLFKVA